MHVSKQRVAIKATPTRLARISIANTRYVADRLTHSFANGRARANGIEVRLDVGRAEMTPVRTFVLGTAVDVHAVHPKIHALVGNRTLLLLALVVQKLPRCRKPA